MSEFTYKSQEVDYLGFLEAQLRDLQGIDRLAYELIQNADDVPARDGRSPTFLIFDVADDALVVQNDGLFRPLDFQRLQRIASGGKRMEADTTGAFGLGFIAVYQVTDAPQIFSNDLHWIIRPEAPPERRIQERKVETSGTRFYLPWAFDVGSVVRRTLRMEAIHPHQLDDFAHELAGVIGPASLFLKRLRVLEVRRNGDLVRRITRNADAQDELRGGQRLLLQEADGQTATWLLFKGEFADEAARLREEYSWQIEDKRHSEVTVAVPATMLPYHGRLFALLPTDSATPLPLHIDADFFPTTDRRRIHFEEGYQAQWNRAAIACAARVLSRHLETLRQELQPVDLWLMLQRVLETKHQADREELPAIFAAFWQSLSPQLGDSPIVYTAAGNWVLPSQARIAPPAASLSHLQALGIAVVDGRLSPYFSLMRRPEIGARDLSLHDLSEALDELGIALETSLALAPPFLRSVDAWRDLWQIVDSLLADLPRHEQRAAVMSALGDVPVALSDMMTLLPLSQVYRGDSETKALFPVVNWINEVLDEAAFPVRFVPQFGVRQAVDRLAEMTQEEVQELWRMGELDLPRLFRWFEARQIEIFADDPALQREIRNLPLVPISGELRPLAHLYIPGGFEDPFNLAAVVDLQALGGRRQFLGDLGLQELDFDTYVHTHIPRVLSQDPDLPSDARHRLLQLLAERLGQIRDDGELRDQLSRLPLIPCMDGSFRAAREVYASREAAALLGTRAHVAEPAPNQALQALHRWLGVRREPSPPDLIQLLLDVAHAQVSSGEPLAVPQRDVVQQCWQRLEQLFDQQQLTSRNLLQLKEARTLPNRAWLMSQPGRLLFVDDPQLAARFEETAPENLDSFLLFRQDALPAVMSAVGVRLLSSAVRLEVVGKRQAAPARTVEQRLHHRHPLIARLLTAEDPAQSDPPALDFLDDLRVLQLPDLRLRYHLQLDSHILETPVQPESARLVLPGKALYLDAEQPPPWAAIARELAVAIKGSSNAAGLALGIREVLAAESYAAAATVLDELGYP